MIALAPASAQSTSLWIGTYADGGGAGLYPLIADCGALAIGAPDTSAVNASFGVHSARFDVHYLVDERDAGALGVYRRSGTGWTHRGAVASGGDAPCHVALDATQSCVAVANYASGSVALYRLDATGMPIAPPLVHVNAGSGPNRERQQSSHAHWVGFGPDNRVLYVADLGTDEILTFPFDAQSGTFAVPRVAFAAPPGSGPRHLTFHARHPHRAYLACELTSMLIVLDVETDGLRPRATLSTLPSSYDGPNIVAHIAANAAGDRLYVSNRGDDSIAVFALDEQGDATPIQHVASGGASPRFFLAIEDERQMVVVHERDHRVTMLDILPDGTLAPTGLCATVPGAAFAFRD